MTQPRALILRSAGANCDLETAHAFELAGAAPERVHVNRLIESPDSLHDYQILAIPGGFSYGDDIAAGRILAQRLVYHLHEPIREFIAAGRPIIGICNGFQVLVKTDLLPGPLAGRSGQLCTLTNNDCGRFVDRWVHLAACSKKCIWTQGLTELDLPIAHGEGRFLTAGDDVRQALRANDQVALVYAEPPNHGNSPQLPKNPNGSEGDVAGICDTSGLVLGLMPHPERSVSTLQDPARRGEKTPEKAAGLQFFVNAVRYVNLNIGAGV